MKDEKKIEMPEDIDVCDDCGNEYPKQELFPDTRIRDGSRRQFCDFCLEQHEEELHVDDEESI